MLVTRPDGRARAAERLEQRPAPVRALEAAGIPQRRAAPHGRDAHQLRARRRCRHRAHEGAGKTTGLAGTNEAWTDAGYDVVGCAVAAKAAHELERTAGIPTTTIAAFTADLKANNRIKPRTILIVDEAGMAGTRTLAPLLDATKANAVKIVLVGDPKQPPRSTRADSSAASITASAASTFATTDDNGTPGNVTPCEHLRDGRADRALPAYQAHNRITTAPTAAAVRARLADDYVAAHHRGEHAAHARDAMARCP